MLTGVAVALSSVAAGVQVGVGATVGADVRGGVEVGSGVDVGADVAAGLAVGIAGWTVGVGVDGAQPAIITLNRVTSVNALCRMRFIVYPFRLTSTKTSGLA